jgi:hypothetical protein
MQPMEKYKKSREVVRDNARKLKAAQDVSDYDIAKGGGPAQRTTNRLLNGKNANLDSLDQLANFFKVQPWQLLVPDMNITQAVMDAPRASKLTPSQEKLLKAYESAPLHIKNGVNSILFRQKARKSEGNKRN